MLSVAYFLVVCFGLISAEDISASYSCYFEDGDCGFANAPDSQLLWENKIMNLGDSEGHVFVIENSKEGTGQMGTLVSPEFQMNVTMPACVSFDLYLSGAGTFTLIQGSGKTAQALYSLDRDSQGWSGSYVTINLMDPSTQFSFEARFDRVPPTETSLIAIDQFVFELNEC